VLAVEPDGSVQYRSAMTDQGNGCRTIVQQMIATVLGIPHEQIDMTPLDTDQALFDQGSGGSRVTIVQGTVAVRAAEALREKLVRVAGDLLEAPAELIELHQGRFFVTGQEQRSAQFAEVAAAAVERGEGTASHELQIERSHDPVFGVFAVEASVDRETGSIHVDRCVLAQDVGFAINPMLAESQIQGGFIQGLGLALTEELRVEEGRVVNPNLGEYKVPSLGDVPPLQVIMVEGHKSHGPWGAKGVGELCHVGVAPAVANAVARAAGVRIKDLPVTAEKVLGELPPAAAAR
jgi:CO/xanthine dehydrogenase Mo-binding subunit